jgi:two-component system NarL family response regulator
MDNRIWLRAYENNSPLSKRETEVLVHIAQGDKNESIAYDLSITPQTIKNHINSILKKLNAKNRTHAVILAAKQKWISINDLN